MQSTSDLLANSEFVHLVLDFRRAQIAPHSGVGRYVQGLAEGISLALKQEAAAGGVSAVKLHLAVSKDFSEKSGTFSYLFTKSNADARWFEKPRFFWSTRLLRKILKTGKGTRVFWIAPDNVDRPWLVSQFFAAFFFRCFPKSFAVRLESLALGLTNSSKQLMILQILHDVIPVQFPSRASLLLRLQMRLFFGVLAQRGAMCAGVSLATRQTALRFFPKLDMLDCFLSPRMAKSFTQALSSCLSESREEVFEKLCQDVVGLSAALREFPITNSSKVFVALGVGRDEPYKCWGLVPKVLERIPWQNTGIFSNFVFIHVCPDWNQKRRQWLGFCDADKVVVNSVSFSSCVTLIPEERTLRLSAIDDLSLARLYRFANCLLHPSECEGFGFPIGEAYLAGLPVVYRKSCGFYGVSQALIDRRGLTCVEEISERSNIAGHLDLMAENEVQFSARAAIAETRLSSENVSRYLLGWESVGAELLRLAKENVK